MRPRILLATLVPIALLVPAFAGCVAPETESDANADQVPPPALNLTLPGVSAAEILDHLRTFSKTFPKRNSDNENHNKARDWLAANLADWGYEVLLDEFTAPASPTATPTGVLTGGRLVNVIGVKWGEDRDSFVVVGAHYDVTDGAVEGAYDDGSGTAIVQLLAKAYAGLATNRTILFTHFDGEEQGLRGSRHMVEALLEGTWLLEGEVVGMIDFDMAGIAYPADPVLVADVPSPEMKDVIDAARLLSGVPDDKIAYRGISGGSSDNGPFKAAEIPSVLFISDFDEVTYRGQQYPSSYPFWHLLDTMETMEEMAGGREKLQGGFQTVVDIGNALLHRFAIDGAFVPTFDASVTGGEWTETRSNRISGLI